MKVTGTKIHWNPRNVKEQGYNGCYFRNSGQGRVYFIGGQSASGLQLWHPADPALFTTDQYFLASYQRKGWTTVLTANNRLQRKQSKKSFPMTARKAVTIDCCHGIGQVKKAAFQAPGYEEKGTREKRKPSRGFSPWSAEACRGQAASKAFRSGKCHCVGDRTGPALLGKRSCLLPTMFHVPDPSGYIMEYIQKEKNKRRASFTRILSHTRHSYVLRGLSFFSMSLPFISIS